MTLSIAAWILFLLYPEVSILGFPMITLCLPMSILGVIFGWMALRQVGAVAASSRPLAQWGLICGLLASVLTIIWLVVFFTSGWERAIIIEPEEEEIAPPDVLVTFVTGSRKLHERS